MTEKQIILAARILSMVFTPFYLPLVGLVLLFWISYMRVLPLSFKLTLLAMVYIFTVLLPTLIIRFYRTYHGWTLIELGVKERRMVPYVVSILCYFVCVYLMDMRNIPRFISIIVVAALVIQMVCALVNVWWKISTHSAAIGGVEGALLAFAQMFSFNPIVWFCLTLLVAGMVGSARMILRQHTLAQVVTGFLLGTAIGYLVVIHPTLA